MWRGISPNWRLHYHKQHQEGTERTVNTEWLFIFMIFGCLISYAGCKRTIVRKLQRDLMSTLVVETDLTVLLWSQFLSTLLFKFISISVLFLHLGTLSNCPYIAICVYFARLCYIHANHAVLCCCGCCYDTLKKLFLLKHPFNEI